MEEAHKRLVLKLLMGCNGEVTVTPRPSDAFNGGLILDGPGREAAD
jgi:hypothetical protein